MADTKVGTAKVGASAVGAVSAGNVTSSDIKVQLSLVKAVGKSGFGIPLILAGGQDQEIPYTECLDLDEVRAVCGVNSVIYTAAALMLAQSTERFKIAVRAVTGKSAEEIPNLLGKDWRQLVVPTEGADGESTVEELSDVVEATDRMYFATVRDLNTVPEAAYSGIQDGQPAQIARDRTVGFYYPQKGVYATAALVGKIAQKQPGTYTCKNLILDNLQPLELDDTMVQSVQDKGCLTFVTKAGDNVTTEGKTIGGEYIDIVDGKDYIIYRIQHDSQKILNQSDKVPYNDNGIAQLEAACVGVMKDCYGDGNLIIATGDDGKPAYTVQYGKLSQTSAAERANRHYSLGRFSFSLLGAIHSADVNGSIII
ncbi:MULTISPECIES: DUF3383 family protein [Caproicibacterium]|uniref:DUF3383 family protein n=1 Tax=Caproicibacterium argilliputei TaxID=3030016 RepID=A0AA97DAY5_9FIRM|nr:DUF3383 family protein [Caproicibacterium argilliputei]WOC33054.1 DUF3383 family protein [Caproicibacterium argilliputei]